MTAAPAEAAPGRATSARLRWSVRAAALAALLAAGWLAWHSLGWGAVRADHVTSDGARSLAVTWSGGQCDGSHRVDVDETTDAVTVTVHRQRRPGLCPAIAVPWTATVPLDAALGGRTVLDGTCLRTLRTASPRDCVLDVRYG